MKNRDQFIADVARELCVGVKGANPGNLSLLRYLNHAIYTAEKSATFRAHVVAIAREKDGAGADQSFEQRVGACVLAGAVSKPAITPGNHLVIVKTPAGNVDACERGIRQTWEMAFAEVDAQR